MTAEILQHNDLPRPANPAAALAAGNNTRAQSDRVICGCGVDLRPTAPTNIPGDFLEMSYDREVIRGRGTLFHPDRLVWVSWGSPEVISLGMRCPAD